jgi:hypothetical protein
MNAHATPLQADADEIERFAGALFTYASAGSRVSLRAFYDDQSDLFGIDDVTLTDEGLAPLVAAAARFATRAAAAARPVVFCPPIATFGEGRGATEADLAEGLVLSVELDAAPAAARAMLEHLLGPATVVVASGGEWVDPETGEIEPKLHLHWRLNEPTRDAGEHAKLKEARTLATALVGGDCTSNTIVHPLRWAGSWHRKRTPRMARIVALNERAEIELEEALGLLREASGPEAKEKANAKAKTDSGFKIDTGSFADSFAEAGIDEVREALTYIDADLPYQDWVGILMAIHDAFGDAGLRAAAEWSARGAKYKEDEVAKKWESFTAGGGRSLGSLFHHARLRGCDLGALARKHRFSQTAGTGGSTGGSTGGPTGGGSADGDKGETGGNAGTDAGGDAKADASGYKGILSSAQFMATMRSPSYLLDGVLQRGRVYSFTGLTGHAKTLLAQLLGSAVGAGRLFGHREVCQGSVLFLAGENAENVKLQFYGLCADQGIDPTTLPIYWHDGAFRIDDAAARVAQDAASIPNLNLVIPDTLQAFFPGDDDNSNIQMLAAARQFRALTEMPSRPTVLIPAHPVKNARRDNLLPRGGSAFLNEVDGNLTVWADDGIATLHWQGKHRGPSFDPMEFELVRTEPPGLVDEKGRQMPCTVARPLLIARGEQIAKENITREDRALQAIRANAMLSYQGLADHIGISKSTAKRLHEKLRTEKWIKPKGRGWVLTAAGEDVLGG